MKNFILLSAIIFGSLNNQAISSPAADQYSQNFSLQHQADFFGYLIKSFSGTMNGNSINLNWELINIDMSMTCSLEASTDGLNFITLKSFDLEAGFQGAMSYQDRNINNSDHYYRLVLSKPGYTSFVSNVIIFKADAATNSYSVQNPFRNQVVIRGNFSEYRTLKIELTDMNGRISMARQLGNLGDGNISFSTASLHAGIYIMRVSNGEGDHKTLVSKCVYKQVE
jgi:hypothetical protein